VFDSISNETLFLGGEIAFFVAGKWCAYRNTAPNDTAISYRRMEPRKHRIIGGHDSTLGNYTGKEVHWWCPTEDGDNPKKGISIVTAFRNFDSGDAVIFDVTWPDGSPNSTVVGSYTSSLANYPSLQVSPQQLPNALSWQGSFIQSVRGFSEGTIGGPTVFYNASDRAMKTVVVGSPWNGNWKAFSAGNNQNWAGSDSFWSPGTSGRIALLPQGYRQSVMLYQRNDGHTGITATMSSWGRIMQQSRKPARGPFKLSDITLQRIGYQTDNGAMYCFCSNANCSKTLLDEIDYVRKEGIAVGYLSFQGAGASTGRGQAAPWCVDTWGVDGGLGKQYPMDLNTFQKALGLPLQLYAPYFCPGSKYFDSEEHPSQWKSVSSDATLPGCSGYDFQNIEPSQSKAFYDWFLGKGEKMAGMVSFETDFMNQNHNCVPEFIRSATGAETWQQGMANAALKKDISIQWCYATPTDMLASLDMPAVTNFRVSFDFCYGGSYRIGESSLLVWALGGAPSKDTLWSTSNNHTEIPGCKWTPDHEEAAAELHVVLALMSKGPVGISDAINYTNTPLLKRTIRKDGTLLKPLKPITAIDSTFLNENRPVFAPPTEAGEGGYVYGTAGLGPSWYFVSFLLQKPFSITLQDFWPPLPSGSRPSILAYRHFKSPFLCRNGADAVMSGCVKLVEVFATNDSSLEVFQAPAAPSTNLPGSEYIPTITSVSMACSKSRWILLGELDKYVPVSPERFQKVECTAKAMNITLAGTAGEEVEVTVLRPKGSMTKSDYTVIKRRVKISKGSSAVTLDFNQSFEADAKTTK